MLKEAPPLIKGKLRQVRCWGSTCVIPLNSLGRCCSIPALQIRKMRLREVEDLAQGHTASEPVLPRGLISIPGATTVFCRQFSFLCLQVGRNGFCSDPPQMSSPGWAPSDPDTPSGKHSHFHFASQVVFEALHNLEPRGYVVGWIIAISLLVGILIFLLLAVLLWKVSVAIAGPQEVPRRSPPGAAQPSCQQGQSPLERVPVGTSFLVQVQQRDSSAPLRQRTESWLLSRSFITRDWTA